MLNAFVCVGRVTKQEKVEHVQCLALPPPDLLQNM